MPVNRNVLLIALDDGSAFDMVEALGPLHYYGFEQFFGESVHFREAYAPVALCQPSRESIMRCSSPLLHNINNNLDEPWDPKNSRPETRCSYRLKREGWFCSTAGKIYHGYFPLPAWVNAILYSETPNFISMGPGDDRPYIVYSGTRGNKGFTDPADEDGFYDMKSRNDCLAFLRREAALHAAGNGRPWYREFGLHAPHGPYDTPDRFKAAYDEADFAAPNSWALGFPMTDFASDFLNDHVYEDGSYNTSEFKGSLRNFASCYSMGLECIANVLAELRAGPFWDNTMVIVFSDHGSHLGSNRRWHKFTTWRAAARAPMLIRVPDGVNGRTVDAPVSLVDIWPTIYDWLGLAPLIGAPGRSLLPILMGGDPPANRWVPTFWFGQASATNGRDRITFAPDEGSIETFDNQTDPWDQFNLGRQHPRFGAISAGALEEFKRWGASIVGQGMMPEPGMPWHLYASRTHGGVQADASFSTMSEAGERPEVAGFQVGIYYADDESRTHRIPRGVDFVRYKAAENIGQSTLIGHAGDKTMVLFDAEHTMSTIDVDLVGGDNHLTVELGTYRIKGGPGNDTVNAASGNDWIDLGAGDDLLDNAGKGADTIFGGPGNDTLIAEAGNDLIYTGPGEDSVHGGDGDDTIHADGGENTLRGGAGSNRFIIYRTERTQIIADLTSADTIDLSAWAPIQPVRVTQAGQDVEITAALERVVCQKTTSATVRSRIVGATLAP